MKWCLCAEEEDSSFRCLESWNGRRAKTRKIEFIKSLNSPNFVLGVKLLILVSSEQSPSHFSSKKLLSIPKASTFYVQIWFFSSDINRSVKTSSLGRKSRALIYAAAQRRVEWNESKPTCEWEGRSVSGCTAQLPLTDCGARRGVPVRSTGSPSRSHAAGAGAMTSTAA